MSYKYTKRPLLEHDKLSIKACMEETMFLGLRMDEGVAVSDFESKFGRPIDAVYGNTLDKLTKEGLVKTYDGYIKLTEKGLEVSNAVLSEFLLDD
jgi:oxygen-independent coproporphyrinogen-3 oxidase